MFPIIKINNYPLADLKLSSILKYNKIILSYICNINKMNQSIWERIIINDKPQTYTYSKIRRQVLISEVFINIQLKGWHKGYIMKATD